MKEKVSGNKFGKVTFSLQLDVPEMEQLDTMAKTLNRKRSNLAQTWIREKLQEGKQ